MKNQPNFFCNTFTFMSFDFLSYFSFSYRVTGLCFFTVTFCGCPTIFFYDGY